MPYNLPMITVKDIKGYNIIREKEYVFPTKHVFFSISIENV